MQHEENPGTPAAVPEQLVAVEDDLNVGTPLLFYGHAFLTVYGISCRPKAMRSIQRLAMIHRPFSVPASDPRFMLTATKMVAHIIHFMMASIRSQMMKPNKSG
jgi:hypothetical protein